MATIHVPSGGDLQAALDSAVAGDIVTLEPGATYIGNFTLRNHGGSSYITVRSAALDSALPADGIRTGRSYAPQLPKLRSTQASNFRTLPAIKTAASAKFWKLHHLEFLSNYWGGGEHVSIGFNDSSQTLYSQQPENIEIDRCIFRGDPVWGQKRGVGCHGKSITVKNSYFYDIATPTFTQNDAICIGGVNGEGPLTVVNNYLEASTENFIIGGDSQKIKTIATVAASPAPTRTSARLVFTGEAPVVGQLLAVRVGLGVLRKHTICRSYDSATGDATFDDVGVVPETPGDVQWGVQLKNITFRGNHVTKPVSWMQPFVPMPLSVAATPGSGGSLAAGSYSYRLAYRTTGYDGLTVASNATTAVIATVAASGKVDLTWVAPSEFATYGGSYRLYRQSPDGAWAYRDVGSGASYSDTGVDAFTAVTSVPGGTRWRVKNLFEIKTGVNVQIDSNIFENSWKGVDQMMAIWLKASSPSGAAPHNATAHVVFEDNIIRHCMGFVNISGIDIASTTGLHDAPQALDDLVIRNNLVYDSRQDPWGEGSSAYAIAISNGATNVQVRHNTLIHDHKGPLQLVASSTRGTLNGLIVKDNLMRRSQYGVKGGGGGFSGAEGTDPLNSHTAGNYEFARNVVDGASASLYPADNFFPTAASFEAQFENYDSGINGDYRLKPVDVDDPSVGLYNTAASDGTAIGADPVTIAAKTASVVSGGSSSSPRPPAITTTTLPQGRVGVAYSQSLEVADGTAPFTFSVVSGSLPPGVTLTSVLSGNPTTAGTYNFTVRVTDANSLTDDQALTIVVQPALVALTVTTESLSSAVIGVSYTDGLASSGGSGSVTWDISVGSLNPGLSLNTATGAITGVPTTTGTSSFTVRATDAAGATATKALSILVNSEAYPLDRPIAYINGEAKLFRRATAPIAADKVMKGDGWIDTSTAPPTFRICSSVTPVTWVSMSGSTAAHTLLSSTHSDTQPATPQEGDIVVFAGGQWQRLAAAPGVMINDGETVSWAAVLPSSRLPTIPTPQNISFVSGSIVSWNNAPVGGGEFAGNSRNRMRADFTGLSMARIYAYIVSGSVTGSLYKVQYWDGTAWAPLAASGDLQIAADAGGEAVSAYVNLATGARSEMVMRIFLTDGNGVSDPTLSVFQVLAK